MTTVTTTAVPEAATIDIQREGVPLSRLVLLETRKMVDTRAGFWLVLGMVIVSALITGAMLVWGNADDLTFGNLFGLMNIPTAILLPVLAILLVTSEWSQRSALVTFTLEPRRSRVVLAKLLTSLIYAVGAVAVALAFGAVGNLLAGALRDGAGAWDMTWIGIGNSALIQFIALLQGFAFGMLLMNSAAAIVLFFGLPTAWGIVSSIVPWLRDNVMQWLEMQTVQQPFQSGEAASASEWAHLGVAMSVWVLLPLVIGVWRLLRSEVK